MNIENLRNVLKSQFINSKVYVNIFLNHIKKFCEKYSPDMKTFLEIRKLLNNSDSSIVTN